MLITLASITSISLEASLQVYMCLLSVYYQNMNYENMKKTKARGDY